MSNFTPIDQLGEFGIIDRIKSKVTHKHKNNLLGIGDDAAIIQPLKKEIVLSTDMLLEGVHFNLSYVPLTHLGYKAVSVNVSDIAAMFAIPKGILVSIAISNRFSVEAVDALYEGIEKACEDYNIDLLGGDTSSSTTGLVISITVLGEESKDKIVKRNGAKVNDIICVTGDLGGAYMGLQVLEREYAVFQKDQNMQPKLDDYSYIVGRQLKPIARMDIVHELKQKNIIPTSMIDISDGLASEILHLSKMNQLGIRIYEDKIPIEGDTFNTIVEFNLSPMTCALNGGEDYELLFSINQNDLKIVEKIADISIIGHYTDSPNEQLLVDKKQNGFKIQAQGWKHFSN